MNKQAFTAGHPRDEITIVGAAQHNLKHVSLRLPKNKLIVFSGVSGSGKSSLAFDTLYAEGQRRYVESLSAYARQFLGQMDKPIYDKLSGLMPTIAIEQKAAGSNPRSTVGTITEIYDHLRVLFARVGQQFCHQCGAPVGRLEPAQIVQTLMELPEGTRIFILAPIERQRKGSFAEVFQQAAAEGYVRARIDGEVQDIHADLQLDKKRKHDVDLVIDRAVVRADERARLTGSVEQGLRRGLGRLIVAVHPEAQSPELPWLEKSFSEARFCDTCNLSFPELTPLGFSFNSPLGACEVCSGLGFSMEVDVDAVIPDKQRSIRGGAIAPWSRGVDSGWMLKILEGVAKVSELDLDKPWHSLSEAEQQMVLFGVTERVQIKWESKNGSSSWAARLEGVVPQLQRRWRETDSEQARAAYQEFFRKSLCSVCDGARLKDHVRAVRVGGRNLPELLGEPVEQLHSWMRDVQLPGNQQVIATELRKEILSRLTFLLQVGLGYLNLGRAANTLSGGESQRIRLASQVGCELTGVLYILDEPSIGLHPRDAARLVQTLEHLRDLGNTVLVVEHDQDTLNAADWLVDFGPGAGRLGGEVVAQGTVADVCTEPRSRTGAYLAGRLRIAVPAKRRNFTKVLKIRGATANNLHQVDVDLPVGVLTAVTGVSGAGKSTLIHEILLPAMHNALFRTQHAVGKHRSLEGMEHFDKVIEVDQAPIGRTPRSNPATYTKLWDLIRSLFAELPEARAAGFGPGRFSFNVKGGRCEHCHGDGVLQIEMHFLADVYVPCEICHGRRFSDATLAVRFKGKHIADMLETTIDEAVVLFENYPAIRRILDTLQQVGLGYMALGQASTTLSGGEAQRIKLAKELARPGTGRTLYVLDEPTTGLHFDDVARLIDVLQRLVDKGNSVLVIEHHLDLIKVADFLIDLGPEGGAAGGRVVATGTPEQVAAQPSSYTGQALLAVLSPSAAA